MKSLKGPPDNVVDVRAKLTVGAKRRLWAIALVLSLSAAGAIWVGYLQLWKPHKYKQTVEFVMRDVLKDSWWQKDPIAGSGKVPIAELQPIDQSLELANILANNKSTAINNQQRIELAHKLFKYSISLDNPFARIDYGIALSEGNLGLPDKLAADYQFSQARTELQEPAQKGKPREVLAYSILLTAGYGGPKDHDAAKSLVTQVLNELNVIDLLRLKDAPGDRKNLGPVIVANLIAKGYVATEFDITYACSSKFNDRGYAASQEMVDHSRDSLEIQRLYFARYEAILQEEDQCTNDLKAKNQEKRTLLSAKTVKGDSIPTEVGEPERIQRVEFTKPQVETKSPLKAPVVRDAEKQADTGYLNGSPTPVAAGLSTFTVDNRSGSADAIARIYLNGNKPAIRQIYIKIGENFKAKDLAAGRYVLRYRFIGSSDTYEADKEFTLEEIPDNQGITYSNVSVTLFTVTDGNMKVKRVPTENF